MNQEADNKSKDLKNSGGRQDMAPAFKALGLGMAVLAMALGPAASSAKAQWLGIGAGVFVGVSEDGATIFPTSGGTFVPTLPVWISPQTPPILLSGMGDLLIYQLIVSGPATDTLTVESANALVFGASYQWSTITNIILGSGAYGVVNVSVPIGQIWAFRVVANAPSGPDPARWARIEPGRFLMGSPESEYDRSADESPQTEVTLTRGFWIGRFEVTQGEYTDVVGTNHSTFAGDPNQPVEQVSWFDATNYCALLTRRERAAGRLADGYEYRLPTEAEWEYTARAGTTNRFFFGDDHSYTALPNYAWFDADSSGSTHDVGGKQPNPWGLYDTSGNVFEWCADVYGPYSGGAVTDPTGPPEGLHRVMRGGSWRFPGGDARSAARNFNTPDFASYGVGFRVVLAQAQP